MNFLNIIKTAITKGFEKLNNLADKIVDQIISKPRNDSAATTTAATIGTAKAIATAAKAYEYTTIATAAGGLATTGFEAGSLASAGASAVTGGAAAPVIAAGTAVLVFSVISGKVISRAAGHLEDYLSENQNNISDISFKQSPCFKI